VPIYEQIVGQSEKLVLSGALEAGTQFPSVRFVSVKHSVNSRTVLKAYSVLSERGVIQADGTRGYFVCHDASEQIKNSRQNELDGLKETVKRIATAGIAKDRILESVEQAYNELN